MMLWGFEVANCLPLWTAQTKTLYFHTYPDQLHEYQTQIVCMILHDSVFQSHWNVLYLQLSPNRDSYVSLRLSHSVFLLSQWVQRVPFVVIQYSITVYAIVSTFNSGFYQAHILENKWSDSVRNIKELCNSIFWSHWPSIKMINYNDTWLYFGGR